mmetsp:Transcript_26222/g.48909  ORF Transcript_26222/g.48909 Transcript_26222/m.48909 type:complete len:226 (+) Transcript_26222:343-1020(+)
MLSPEGFGSFGEAFGAIRSGHLLRNLVIERSCPRIALGEKPGQVEDLLHSRQDGRQVIFRVVLGLHLRCGRRHNLSFRDPWRDKEGWNADTQPIKLEVLVWEACRIVRGRDIQRGGHMVVETAMFVISDDKESFVPLRRHAQRLVYLLHQALSKAYIMVRMLIVRTFLRRLVYKPSRVDPAESRQVPLLNIPHESPPPLNLQRAKSELSDDGCFERSVCVVEPPV